MCDEINTLQYNQPSFYIFTESWKGLSYNDKTKICQVRGQTDSLNVNLLLIRNMISPNMPVHVSAPTLTIVLFPGVANQLGIPW